MRASELPEYSDKEYMDSIHEYLRAIRPYIVKLEQEQWEKVGEMKEKESEVQKQVNKLNNEYLDKQSEIEDMLSVVSKSLAWNDYRYDKRVNHDGFQWVKEAVPMVSLVGGALKIDDGHRLKFFMDIH